MSDNRTPAEIKKARDEAYLQVGRENVAREKAKRAIRLKREAEYYRKQNELRARWKDAPVAQSGHQDGFTDD